MFKLGVVASLALVIVTLAAAKPFPPVEFNNVFGTRQAAVSYRLPNETYPLHYKVHLNTRVDIQDFAFTGEVEIDIGIAQATQTITLHALSVEIDSVDLYKKDTPDTPLDVSGFTLDTTTDFLVITAAQQLTTDNTYVLVIKYHSNLRTDEAGFYRAWYTDDEGNNRYLATTQFESTDARHAFPCYDEPRLRSTFDISITHGATYNAVSNMPVKNVLPIGDDGVTVTTTFETTVNMPTYLLAFIISDYTYLEDATVTPLQRAYSQPNRLEDSAYVLKAGVDIMKAFEDYLDVDYSLAKIDQFGINQFAAGAMENWGLVTYRSPYFHWNPETSTTLDQMNVASIVAHEYAHQWFGNLVTPKWWTYLWLNEGFATLYEHEAVELAYPEMRFSDMWSLWVVQSVFAVDSADTTRPMTHYAESPNAISNLFDRVAYPKSGSVLRMIKNFITEPVWKQGLKQYLTEMAFKAAEPEDLFRNLQAAVKESTTVSLPVDIKVILDTWTTKRGYPLVSAHRHYDDAGSIHITQSRFMDATKEDPELIVYYVPVNIASKSTPNFADTTADLWFDGLETSFVPAADSTLKVAKDDWLLINKRQAYYYRVNYDDDNWLLLANELNEGDYTKIDLLNRAQLIDDAFDLARYDHLDYSVAMHIVKYLSKELDYIPWGAADNGLTELYRLMRDSDSSGYFNQFVGELVAPVYKSLGVSRRPTDDHLTRLHRTVAMKWACRTGSEECLDDTLAVMKTVVNDGVVVDPDLKTAIYCHGMRKADSALFEKFLGQAESSDDGAVRNAILGALGCNENEDVLESTITKMLEGTTFTVAEKRTFINAVFANSAVGFHTVLHLAAGDKADTVKTLYGTLYATFLNNLAGYATTAHYQEDLVSLLNKYDDISAANKATIGNRIEANLAFVAENGKEVSNFLVAHYDGAAASVVASFAMVIVAAVTSYALL